MIPISISGTRIDVVMNVLAAIGSANSKYCIAYKIPVTIGYTHSQTLIIKNIRFDLINFLTHEIMNY